MLYQDASTPATPWSWSADNLIVIQYTENQGELGGDIGIYSVSDETFTPHLTTPFSEQNGVISPDGRLLAYSSDETGRPEIYVEAFPDQTDRWRLSTAGGVGPSWSRDGRELYFIQDFTRLMAVSVQRPNNGSSFRFGEPELLFTTDFKEGGSRQSYDTIDGQTFVVNRRVADQETTPLTLVVNALSR